MGNMDSNQALDELADQIAESLNVKETDSIQALAAGIETGAAKRVLVLSGAGVSVAAGIPDFRTPGTGLYDNLQKYDLPYPQAVFDVEFYRKNPQPFCTLAQSLWPGLTHSPTKTHCFVKILSEKGMLLRNWTQNIDGLECLAGIPADELVECHGHFRTASCVDCYKAADEAKVKDSIVIHGNPPVCRHCGGYVKPDIVFFGESLPGRFHQLLKKDLAEADMLLIMGTSLQVAPVSMIPDMVRCPRVLINREQVLAKRRKGDLFLEGDCDDTVEELCSLLGWTDELSERHAKTRISSIGQETTDSSDKRTTV